MLEVLQAGAEKKLLRVSVVWPKVSNKLKI